MKAFNLILWFLFILLAIAIGLYPFGYIISDVLAKNALLSQKPDVIVANDLWSAIFYTHILIGGVAMLTGWSQFLEKFRNRNLGFHRSLGKVYVIAVLLSSLAGLYIAFFAEGGLVAQLGFSGLAIAWFYTTLMAYTSIRKGNITQHKHWMIRSYALTFAAVTLRIWLPMFQYGFGMDFLSAYVIIAWLCWIPNMIWAEWKIKRISLA